ncbi:MAG TPA: B12-binding domain-containing radical SAM protein, partial [bacterium]|nr:B12-binding domain-containing radical SAM protein [bacterium]
IIARLLKNYGFTISLIDCLDRSEYHYEKEYRTLYNNSGKFKKIEVSKPECLKFINRKFYRYGITLEEFEKKLQNTYPKPSVICVTCMMSYWYYGANETIKIIRKFYPDTPIIFGGIYHTLWTDHSKKNIDADYFIEGAAENKLLLLLNELFDLNLKIDAQPEFLAPDYSLYQKIYSAPVLTTRGCIFNCDYCASKILFQKFIQYPIDRVFEIINYLVNVRKIEDIAFYDDALLYNAQNHFAPLMKKIIDSNIKCRFHLPNAVHIKYITFEIAELMKLANFDTIRLGLEAIDEDWHNQTSGKFTLKDYDSCLDNFNRAGIDLKKVKAYILTGLPEQSLEDIKKTAEIIKSSGIDIEYAFYSPIPHTQYWQKSIMKNPEILNEPLLTNCSVYSVLNNLFFDRRRK